MIDDTNSRYVNTPRVSATLSDGHEHRIMRRRFLPQASSVTWMYEITVIEGMRLDLIAAKQMGEPELAWRLYDANNAMNPWELLHPAGRQLRIPAVQFGAASLPVEPEE